MSITHKPKTGATLTGTEYEAADAHIVSGLVSTADTDWVDLTDGGATTLHTHAGGSGAPTTVDYLVGTADAGLSNEIVVGTTPGGELGGTWASPTVDASHSGSTHAATQAAAESTAATALSGHVAAGDPHPVYLTSAEGNAAYQPVDSDLTAIGGLTPNNDDIIQRKAGTWTNRTMAQLIADLSALGTTFQPLDSDLTAIAALATTAFGRSLLTLADAAALLSAAGAAASVHTHAESDVTSLVTDLATKLATSAYRTAVEDPTFELAGDARMTLPGTSEMFFATNDRQFRMSAAYAQSMTVPNGYYRVQYQELRLVAANRLSCIGTSDFILTDLGAHASRLTIAGRS